MYFLLLPALYIVLWISFICNTIYEYDNLFDFYSLNMTSPTNRLNVTVENVVNFWKKIKKNLIFFISIQTDFYCKIIYQNRTKVKWKKSFSSNSKVSNTRNKQDKAKFLKNINSDPYASTLSIIQKVGMQENVRCRRDNTIKALRIELPSENLY